MAPGEIRVGTKTMVFKINLAALALATAAINSSQGSKWKSAERDHEFVTGTKMPISQPLNLTPSHI